MSEPVDTLIITVGTRQIGWHCRDGIIRSLGFDANVSYPPHVDELYQELGINRGVHEENNKTYPWSNWDLSQRFYEHCVYELDEDFNKVELLLDAPIIEAGVKQGLKHIILWGTNQPDTVSWFYRRLDTCWSAKLMAGKIKSIWKNLRVDVHEPKIVANNDAAIKAELELLILHDAISLFSPSGDRQFTLWIQNKGCAPAIASAVEICAAALVRQCDVFNASPIEPDNFFELQPNGYKSACPSVTFKLIPMGEYFWPLERLRVISSWERGDFSEVLIWLKPHQKQHKALYKLAEVLCFATNWQTDKYLSRTLDWLRLDEVIKFVNADFITAKKLQVEQIRANEIYRAWEFSFLIELALNRQNYTAAFIQFVQTLERILYIYANSDNWIGKGLIIIPDRLKYLGNKYQPGFKELIDGWCSLKKYSDQHQWFRLLHKIRSERNQVIHLGKSLTLGSIRTLWQGINLFTVSNDLTEIEAIKYLMISVLKQVCDHSWQIPEKTLMKSLYEWGLNTLKSESATIDK